MNTDWLRVSVHVYSCSPSLLLCMLMRSLSGCYSLTPEGSHKVYFGNDGRVHRLPYKSPLWPSNKHSAVSVYPPSQAPVVVQLLNSLRGLLWVSVVHTYFCSRSFTQRKRHVCRWIWKPFSNFLLWLNNKCSRKPAGLVLCGGFTSVSPHTFSNSIFIYQFNFFKKSPTHHRNIKVQKQTCFQ